MALADSSFLTDDDHDTWCLLSSGEDGVDLTGVGQRFLQDQSHSSRSDYWQLLLDTAKSLGFDISQQLTTPALTQPVSLALPAAFETSSGKKHVDSLCKLIQVDATECVTLTFGALKDINTDHHLQSLLGSRSLFIKVLLHYCQQRSARLGIVVELLRENSNDAILEDVDSPVLLDGAHRGIFQKLISCACSPNSPPTRDQVLPLKDIGDEFFIQQVLQILVDQRLLEREQALEGLLGLFYARLSATCVDLSLLVLALHSCGEFFTVFSSPRLTQLSGLLCAEAVNLNTAGPNHIMMSPGAPLDLLTNIVMNFYDQVDRRRRSNTSIAIVPAPESIAMLSIGLLLKVCEHDDAMQCLQLANDCGAFDYLQFCFDTLLPSQTASCLGVYQDTPGYDWQFSNPIPTLSIEGESHDPGMPANSILYTSIGLELLNSVVLALGEYMKSPENLALLCNLGATLFANQPILCEEFWRQPGCIGKLVETSIDETIASWKILASLCCDRPSVDRIMAMIPAETISMLLSTAGDDAVFVITALSKMARYNPSAIRHALLDDPGVLFRILSVHPSNDTVLEPILTILAAVLRDCPPWATIAIKFFGARSSHDLLATCFTSAKTDGAAACVLQSLVEVMSLVCFTSSDQEVLEYLAVTVKGGIAACQSLTTIFAFSSQPAVSYTHAYRILKATTELITTLRLLSLHTSLKVREVAMEARATMLEMFSTSTSFGLALSYFAGAPVSLSIGVLLEEMVQEARLLQGAADEYAVDDATNPMGKWHGVLRVASESPILKFIQDRLGAFENVRLDMAAIHSRRWSDGESATLFAASAAISLFKVWAVEAEEFQLTQMVPDDFLANASPHRLLLSTATMPPVIRSDARLAHLWPACGLRTCDLLVHLVANTESNGLDMPFYDSLALLSIVTAHAKSCGGLAPKVFETSGPLYAAMRRAISEASDALCGKSDTGDVELRKGIMFVKLLSNIMAVDHSQGVTLLEYDTSALCAALVDAVKAVTSGADGDKSDRFAAECLRVLRSANMTNNIIPDLVAFATYSGPESILRTDLVAQSLEILAHAVSTTGCDVSQVHAIFMDKSLHERHVPKFRDSLIAMRKSMSNFTLLTSSSSMVSLNLSDPGPILHVFTSGDTRLLENLASLNPHDIKSAASMIFLHSTESADAPQVASVTNDLVLSMVFVDKHVSAVAAWSMFVQAWTSNGRDATSSITNNIGAGLVDTMYELAELKTEVEKEVATLSSKIEAVLGVSSELLLTLVSLNTSDASLEHIELRKLVGTMETALPRAGFLPGRCALLTNLLAAAAVVIRDSSTAIDSARFVPIIRQGLAIGSNASTFKASLLLLSSIINSKEVSEERKAREKFANALSQTGLIKALVDEVLRACTSSIHDKDTFDDEQVTAVTSLFTVLLSLCNLGNREASLVPLFMESNLPKMFLSNPMFAQAIPRWTAVGTDSYYRGYIKSPTKISNNSGMGRVSIFLAGSSDPVHTVWRLGIRLLTSLLRFSSIHGLDREFQQLALNFIVEYDGALRSCLAQCSAVGVSSVLTRNLVDEADEILALLSQLSTKGDRFLDVTVMLVGSLGKFLGSIGTSRFLFNLVRDAEAANQEQDSPFDNLQELHSSLSGGIGNARFEAIRYAHYARSAYAMVTGDDNLQFSIVGGQSSTGSELEVTCFNAINNEFCAELQFEVATCLTNAATFLSKIHPASRSFTRFSNEETRRLNPFNIVKTGAIIAAHSADGLEFARVVSTDTVRRSWKCKAFHPETMETSTDVTISIDDLAGVEDIMKRQNLFHFLAAPDSATHMESADYSASSNIGHLILVLQWCRQGGVGTGGDIRTNLAESTAMLLATELALHREIGTDKMGSELVSKNVNDQLFDLFDDRSKFPDLISCLGPSFLIRFRAQLKTPLELARKDRAEKRHLYEERLAAVSASNLWR